MMRNAIRRRIKLALLGAAFAATIGSGTALAQSGSAGGSIGNDEKSLSGSRQEPRAGEPDRPARRSKPEAEESQRSTPRRSGGGNFDGAWVVVSVGTTCSGGSTTAVVVTSGRIIGEGVTGTISPGGGVSSVGHSSGITIVSSGYLSGRSGSGTFKQSDGCAGRWTALKQ